MRSCLGRAFLLAGVLLIVRAVATDGGQQLAIPAIIASAAFVLLRLRNLGAPDRL